MSRTARFLVAFVSGLAALAWVATTLVQRTTRRWYEHDLLLRARLAVGAARPGLATFWTNPGRLSLALQELVRDERILAAAACAAGDRRRAVSTGMRAEVACSGIEGARPAGVDSGGAWAEVGDLPGGPVHISSVPIWEGARRLGSVIVVHDLSYAERREAGTRMVILLAFGAIAAAGPLLLWLALRISWRGWSDEIRRVLRGGRASGPEFQPILGDVRELVARLAAEREQDREGGAWTPQRLRQTLTRHLHGEKVVILANREPYIHQYERDGQVAVVHPASGLVSALEPVMRACSGTWVAHGSGDADRAVSDANDRVRVPPGEESYSIRRVWLNAKEQQGYYYGFSNEGLWPLCHLAHVRPVFRADDWLHYQAVNRKFVDAVCTEVDSEDPIVLVEDYHFALAPRLIHERLPHATIIMFWHIPWPNAERVGICPWREELLDGMLGASILGFHTQAHCNNFVDAADRYLESRIDRESGAVVREGRATLIRPYPISVEWPNRWADAAPPPTECRRAVTTELGLRSDALIGLGVDRLDYTKGVEERFLAVERLLERWPEFVGRFTFVQLAAPSRTAIATYHGLNETVDAVAGRINQRFGSAGYRPIVLLRSHHEPAQVFRFYRAADVCYVSSLHDGMNLVAKEFVAARSDERGVLVLSQFTGAAKELTEALVVNPYDLDQASAAVATALTMSDEEQRERMAAMRRLVAHFNVYRWAGRMLADAARLRNRDRLNVRLGMRDGLVFSK
jgi:trehalose 6-phosphate synthase